MLKLIKYPLILFLSLVVLYMFIPSTCHAAGGTGWTWTDVSTATPVNTTGLNWTSIASSSNGAKLVVSVYNGDIYTYASSTWTDISTVATGTTGLQWMSVASDSTGANLVAAEYDGDIWIYSAATWTDIRTSGTLSHPPIRSKWNSVASSSDGSKIVAAVQNGDMWIYETATGWTDISSVSTSNLNWVSVACNSDCSKIVAAVQGGDVWTYSSASSTWTDISSTSTASLKWTGVATSSDFSTIVACVGGPAATDVGDVWTYSTSSGIWTDISLGLTSDKNWKSVASDSNGNKIVAVDKGTGGSIWTYSFSTASWTQQTQAGTTSLWQSVTSDSSGTKLAAVVSNGNAWQGSNSLTATSTSVSSSQNPSTNCSSVTFTANVSSTGGAPVIVTTGTVKFKDGSNVICARASVGTGGQATCTTSSLSAGTHSITAFYGGDSTYAASTSSALSQVVNSCGGGGGGGGGGGYYTTTTLTSSANPATYGTNVAYTATVKGLTPTGIVTFKDNSTTIAAVSLDINGKASFSTSSLSAGTHPMTAVYGGDLPNPSSTSGVLSEVITPAATTTSITSSSNPISYSASLTLTATVSGASPTGYVTFIDNTTTLATVALSGQAATYTTTSLSVGSHPITAVYSGDTNNNSSTSAALGQLVTNPNITLATSVDPSVYGQTVTFKATVTGYLPTGTVTFIDNNSNTIATVNVSNATAAFSTALLTADNHTITAVYSGDTNNKTSTSVPLVQTVSPNSTKSITFAISGNGSILIYDDNYNLMTTITKGGSVSLPYGSTRLYYFLPASGSVTTQMSIDGRQITPVSVIRAVITEDYVIGVTYSP